MVARRFHEDVKLRTAFFSTRDGHVEIPGDEMETGPFGEAGDPVALEIRVLHGGGDAHVGGGFHHAA